MPELPEVETVVRGLRHDVIGRTIGHVVINWPRQINTHTPPTFAQAVQGRMIIAVHRRAKYIHFALDNGWGLVVHLRMTGHLSVQSADLPLSKHDHIQFWLDDGRQLRFHDIRKFGTVGLWPDVTVLWQKLGPEPLEEGFTVDVLRQQLGGRSTKIKPLLLDQTVVAGIGNIYADEALFFAKIAPHRLANSLADEELSLLHEGIQHVLQLGIQREGASIDNYVKPNGEKGEMQNAVSVFRRTGEPCYRCGTAIERIVLGGRSTHFCPVCQR